jgi:hypothetical protein
VPSFGRTLQARLVIGGIIVIMVLVIAIFLLVMLPILEPAFDLATCISAMDHVAQVTVVSIMPL